MTNRYANDLVDDAEIFATEKHAGQTLKFSGGLPYILHPAGVVQIVRSVDHTPPMLAASWLHDTIEDTDTSYEEVVERFGREVADLVLELTKVSRPEHGSREQRASLDRAHLALISPAAKTIKLADVIHNSSDIWKHDPSFARRWLGEKVLALDALQGGDPALWKRAHDSVHNSLQLLGLRAKQELERLDERTPPARQRG